MLNADEIRVLIEKKNLVSGYIDLETQLTPNGFDLTVKELYAFEGAGRVDFSNKERLLPPARRIEPGRTEQGERAGWWKLSSGAYKILTNETVTLPPGLAGLAFSRSTLLRCGVFVQNAVWDAGFSGRSEFMLFVENPAGVELKENARLIQLVFMPMKSAERLYNGVYNNI